MPEVNKDFKTQYAANYDERAIRSQYQDDITYRILRQTKYTVPAYVLTVGGYYVYSDLFIRNIPQITPWRIPTVLCAILFLILTNTSFKKRARGVFVAYNVVLASVCLMMAAITWLLFPTDLFKTSISGMLVAIFAVYIGNYGGLRTLFIHYLPILLMIVGVYFHYQPPVSVMVDFANVLGLILTCLIVSQIEENLRFREFRFRKIAEVEKERSNSLLLNILPEEIADEIKTKGKATARKFESATVLFTDFEKFTKLAESMPPENLVKSIDYYFSTFDAIVEKYNLEKIKTIGDSYMCVGGIPTSSPRHAHQTAMAALEILAFVKNDSLFTTENIQKFQIRIGIHTGPVIAGIVGLRKFQYDVWGDSVNIASRMESASEVGRINISESTYHHIKDEFDCSCRGVIEVKNRGGLKMYFLNSALQPKNPTVSV